MAGAGVSTTRSGTVYSSNKNEIKTPEVDKCKRCLTNLLSDTKTQQCLHCDARFCDECERLHPKDTTYVCTVCGEHICRECVMETQCRGGCGVILCGMCVTNCTLCISNLRDCRYCSNCIKPHQKTHKK